MQDQLVTLETAKKAKRKGFWWDTFNFAYETSDGELQLDYGYNHTMRKNDSLKVPTQSLMQKFARVEYNKNMYPIKNKNGWLCVIIDLDDEDDYEFTRMYTSYEDALEAGITLFLEEIVK